MGCAILKLGAVYLTAPLLSKGNESMTDTQVARLGLEHYIDKLTPPGYVGALLDAQVRPQADLSLPKAIDEAVAMLAMSVILNHDSAQSSNADNTQRILSGLDFAQGKLEAVKGGISSLKTVTPFEVVS